MVSNQSSVADFLAEAQASGLNEDQLASIEALLLDADDASDGSSIDGQKLLHEGELLNKRLGAAISRATSDQELQSALSEVGKQMDESVLDTLEFNEFQDTVTDMFGMLGSIMEQSDAFEEIVSADHKDAGKEL